MITFEDHGASVVLVYNPDGFGAISWVDNKLQTEGHATLSRVFTVQKADLLSHDGDEDDEDVRRFVVGSVGSDYRTIRADVLGLGHDLLIAVSRPLERRTFVAERNISIFRRIDALSDEQIIIGGAHGGAIPDGEFSRLLREFPTSREVDLYAGVRVTRVLREYLDTMSDAEVRLTDYMERRAHAPSEGNAVSDGRIPAASALELEKFIYVRDRLIEMLAEAEGYSEAQWQAAVSEIFLLVFPQYIAVLGNVHIKERYSKQPKSSDRYIDLILVAANGCVDIIEIKKPTCSLLSKAVYRNNHVPAKELSGAVMQAEKYLFYLTKSGRDGEVLIEKKRASELPDGVEIKVASPKAIVLAGRDADLSMQETFGLQFVRRTYSNVVDIITYDDLLRRLESIIEALRKRVRADGALHGEIGEPE